MSEEKALLPEIHDIPPAEFVRSYYGHQYDRMTKLEEQRLTFTNIIVTLTVLAFTLVFSSLRAITQIGAVGILLLIVALNSFAIVYSWRTLQYIRVHRERAKTVLKKYAQEVYKIDEEKSLPHVGARLGLAKLQMLLHVTLIVFALVLTVLLLLGVLIK